MTPPTDPEHTWFTIDQVAAYLNITVRHVRRLVAERRIPHTRVGGHRGRLRFNQADVDTWMRHNSVHPDGGGRAA